MAPYAVTMKRTVVLSVGFALLAPFIATHAAERPSAAGSDNWRDAPVANWPTNGGNYSNQRYSPLARIDRSNVAKLKGVWRTRLRGSGTGAQYSGEAQPLVYDGVAYVITGADDVFALVDRQRRDPLAIHGEPRSRASRRSAAAGRAAASP